MAVSSKTKPKTVKKSAPPKKTRKTIPSTEFQLHAPNASEVFLAGEFNNWDPAQFRMRKFKGDVFKKKLPLKPGRYEYKFVVNGEWCTDPANAEKQQAEIGVENSVITIS